MTRTADPNSVVYDFEEFLDDSVAQFEQVTKAVELLTIASAKKLKLHRQVASDALMRAAIGFESFRSDWHVRAINRAPAAFENAVKEQITSEFSKKWGAAGLSAPTVELPPLTLNLVQALLDPHGTNVRGLTDPPDVIPGRNWKKKAASDLGEPFKSKALSLPNADLLLINALVRIRNAIAHRSASSLSAMNDALARPQMDAALKRDTNKVTVSGIGAYLGATTSGKIRVVRYHERLREIAGKLLVSAPKKTSQTRLSGGPKKVATKSDAVPAKGSGLPAARRQRL